MAEGKMNFSRKNPAVKRIMQEIRELQSEDSPEFKAEAFEENIFEWHFAIRGPPDTEFEGGIYHGRILLPSEYPFKPPEFIMLTKNGRWETNTKICLSISSHHPEHWQPSWSVRTALMALKAFMPTPANGAIGSLDYSKQERQRLARFSREEAPKFGTAERQQLTMSVHQKMLDANPASEPDTQRSRILQAAEARRNSPIGDPQILLGDSAPENQFLQPPSQPIAAEIQADESCVLEDKSGAKVGNDKRTGKKEQENQANSREAHQPVENTREVVQNLGQGFETQAVMTHNQEQVISSWEERGLNFLALALFVAIIAILGRRALAGVDIAEFF